MSKVLKRTELAQVERKPKTKAKGQPGKTNRSEGSFERFRGSFKQTPNRALSQKATWFDYTTL